MDVFQAVKYLKEAIQHSTEPGQLADLYFDLGNHNKDAGDLDSAMEVNAQAQLKTSFKYYFLL